jgi:arylsulfatase
MSGASLVIGGWMSVILAFQAPDFSGQWRADPATPAATPLATATPAPQARGDMGSGWGSPLTITQDARQLVVEQALFSRYDLQPPLRFVYALDGSETRNAVMTGHTTQVRLSRTTWAGQALRITTIYPALDPASGQTFTTEVTHTLSLESPATLVIEVTRGGALGGLATTTRTTYRKG